MADKKISQLTTVSAVGSTDLTVVVQGTATFKATMAQIATRIAAELTAQGIAGSLSIAGGALSPASTFTRAGDAYWDGVLYPANTPRFVDPSQSGVRGVLVEEAGTNLFAANQARPSTTVGLTALGTPAAVLSIDATQTYVGGQSLKVVCDGTAANQGVNIPLSTTGTGAHTGQVRIKGPAGATLEVRLALGGLNVITLTGGWDLIVPPSVTYAGTNPGVIIRTNTAQAITFNVDALDIKAKAYATSWVPGATTQAAETLTVPTNGLLTPSSGSVILKYYWPGGGAPGGIPREVFFHQTNYPSANVNAIAIDITSTQTRAYTGNAAGAASVAAFTGVPSAGWHQVGIRFSAASVSLWQDGASKASVAGTNIPSALDTNFYLGRSQADTNHLNQPIAFAYFYSRVLSDAEMAAATSGNPPPDFTAYLDFTQGVLAPDEFAVDGRITAEHGIVVKSGVVSLPAASIGDLALSANVQLRNVPHQHPVYLKSALPAQSQGATIYVSDLTGGGETCFSDGTNWRRNSDRTVAS